MNIKRHSEFKMVDGKLYQGTRAPLARSNAGNCAFCGLEVMVSSGQLVTYFNGKPTHRPCRKDFERNGRSGKLRR